MSTATRALAGIRTRSPLELVQALAPVAPIAIGAALAIVSSVPLPRGPVTAGQAILCIGASLLAGLIAGRLSRSSWSILLAPLGYVVAYEVARSVMGVAGATFGPIRLDNTYGIVALVAGRGFHGLLALLPMAAGASLGVVLGRPHHRRAWIPGGLLAAATVALGVAVALPASVPPVTDATGRPVPGSIAELSTVTLGGVEQTIAVRAADPANPVLLYLSGGPGQSDIAFSRALLEPLTRDFVVVTWDQRGNGTSYPALEPVATFTLDQAVSDTVALAEHLAERFDEQKIYLLGESWGSTLGVLAVQRRPDLFHAYIGSGQMVSQRVTDQRIWRDLLAATKASGDWELYDQVLSLGEPPYRDTPWANSIIPRRTSLAARRAGWARSD
jgi:proline iminopeptidase